MVEESVDRFIAAAADAYRSTGNARATTVADILVGHITGAATLRSVQPPAAAHLGAAARASGSRAAVHELAPAIESLDWTEGNLPVPPSLPGRYCFVTLVGDGSARPDQRLLFGLYLQAPHTYYPSHWHHAEELYFVLSGEAEWAQGGGALALRPPGTLVHHAPDEPHTMVTGDQPLLAMWAWLGDLGFDSYRFG